MKNLLVFLSAILFASCSTPDLVIKVPANQSAELDYPNFDFYTASVNNQSINSISVSVVDKTNESQVRGFGLGPKGNEDVIVEKGSKLVLENGNNSEVKVTVSIAESEGMPEKPNKEYISFTLRNTTMKSIPLQIPSVMNPNLSPNSKSGVDLKIGQEIYFKSGGKKHLLLKVDNTMKDGQEVDVAALIKERKEELGLK